MKLLVILLCLFSERYLVHAISYQRFSWFGDYSAYIKHIAEKNNTVNPWILLAMIALPVIIVAAVIYYLLCGLFYGFVGLLLSIALFFYALGPQNIFYPITHADSDNAHELVGTYFSMVNRQLFCVIFWFIIAGPVAALAYRVVVLCRETNDIHAPADQLTDLLEWIPARLTALFFLLVGNFQRGLNVFVSYFLTRPSLNNEMLRECGLKAVSSDDAENVPMPVAESLVEHAVIVALVLIALFTLISWL